MGLRHILTVLRWLARPPFVGKVDSGDMGLTLAYYALLFGGAGFIFDRATDDDGMMVFGVAVAGVVGLGTSIPGLRREAQERRVRKRRGRLFRAK
jgi:hypothetical protein